MAEPQEGDREPEHSPVGRLCLDDFHVGQRFTSGTHVMDAAQIKAFARQFDPQPFHLDEEAARNSVFQGLAASGWHTAAITMRLLVSGGPPFAAGSIGMGGEIEWPRPTRPTDVLHVESEILEIIPSRSKPNQGIVRVRNITLNQDGAKVQVLIVKVLVFRRAAAAGKGSLGKI